MVNINDLKTAIDKLESVLSVPTHGANCEVTGLELRNVEQINKPINQALNTLKRQYDKLERKLKKEARGKLVELTAACIVANGYELTDDKIWEVADIVSASYNNPDDLRSGREFAGWYLDTLNRLGTWSEAQGKRIYPKQTRFFNDVRRELLK
jgi:hypothetical protein